MRAVTDRRRALLEQAVEAVKAAGPATVDAVNGGLSADGAGAQAIVDPDGVAFFMYGVSAYGEPDTYAP